MTMDIRKRLQQPLNEGTFIRLALEDGGHEGFVVGLSPSFVLLQAIYEYQDVGALIVPLEGIEDFDVSDYHDDQLKILAFNSIKRTKRYAWVKLGSFADIFQSLKAKGKFVVVSADDEADVGQIDAVHADSVDLKAIDPGGNWIEGGLGCDYDDITLIQFDDSYSRVLQRYVERAATLN